MENQISDQQTQTNAGQVLGIIALVLGILGVITSLIPCFGIIAIVFGVIAAILGGIGYSQAKKDNGSKALPMAGLILGVIATVFAIIWLMVFTGAAIAGADKYKDQIEEATQKIDQIEEATQKIDSINEVNKEKDTIN